MEYGCFCELEPGMEPDLCVIDDPDYTINDCVHAQKGIKKECCKYWKPINGIVKYDLSIENKLNIVELIRCFFAEKTPLSEISHHEINPDDILDYIMRVGRGKYNPKTVLGMINVIFNDE